MARFKATTTSGVEAIAARARIAQAKWSSLHPSVRAAALDEAARALQLATSEFTELGVREVGKPTSEMRDEVARGVATLRYFAQAALDPIGDVLPSDGSTLLLARTRPVGTVGLVTPWNFPVAIPIWKFAPALSFGNAALLKPAPEATGVALRLVALMNEFLPPDLLAVVPGGADTGRALTGVVDAVSFTGSTAVGKTVSVDAVLLGLPVQAEMGGLNATIVMPDADLGHASRLIARAAMGYAGQKCTATSRVIIVGDPAPFSEAFVLAVQDLVLGDPSDEKTVVGPVINEAARKSILMSARRALESGNRCLTGGSDIDREGWYVQPTVFDQVSPSDWLAQNEVFGPVCSILEARDDEEAVSIANNVDYGLSGSVFTGDLDRAIAMIEKLHVGLAKVNTTTTGAEYYAPFGGVSSSSFGPREQRKAAREFYTWTQTVGVSRTPNS